MTEKKFHSCVTRRPGLGRRNRRRLFHRPHAPRTRARTFAAVTLTATFMVLEGPLDSLRHVDEKVARVGLIRPREGTWRPSD
jgi:hypothetical protein